MQKSNYRRPKIKSKKFYDSEGNEIRYGNRWSHLGDEPPEESYSVDSNTERFAPLHSVADELIVHLLENYSAEVTEGVEGLGWLRHVPDPDTLEKVVTLTPSKKFASPITFVFTKYPGVHVHAGEFLWSAFPSCGCDACDETWESAAELLEHEVLAIAEGGFSEKATKGKKKSKIRYEKGMGIVSGGGVLFSHTLERDGEKSSEETHAEDIPKKVLKDSLDRLKKLKDVSNDSRWLAWE